MTKFIETPNPTAENSSERNIDERMLDIKSEFTSRLRFGDGYKEWQQKYNDDPLSFFNPDNIEELKMMDPDKRLAFFGWSSQYLGVSPSDADIYFNAFPEDLAIIKMMLEEDELAQNIIEFSIFGLSALRAYEGTVREEGEYYFSKNKWLHICDRRIEAPKHILSNQKNRALEKIKSFGDSSIEYLRLIRIAGENPLGLDEEFDTEQMFSSRAYSLLKPEQKINLLRLLVSDLQYCLVFNETNNSEFTREHVESENARTKELSTISPYSYSVAHSMLFGTFQPSASYDFAQSIFEHEMNSTADTGGAVEEYPFHKMLLEVLHEYRNQAHICTGEDIKLIAEFWDKNRNPIFANAVAYLLSEIDPELSSQELLARLKDCAGEKNALIAILYRIEFKRLGISPEGVRYLNRMYDLAELNNPDYFVQRLSPDGEMGIFDKDSILIRYFQLGDISDGQTKIRADVLDFTYDMLLTARPNETPEERRAREKYLQEFTEGYINISDSGLFSKEIKANSFTLKDQYVAITAMRELDEKTKEKLVELIGVHGESLVRIFLRFYALDARVANMAIQTMHQCRDAVNTEAIITVLLRIVEFMSKINNEYEDVLSNLKFYEEGELFFKPRYLTIKERIIPEVQKVIMERLERVLFRINTEQDTASVNEALLNIKPEALMVEVIMKTARGNFQEVNFSEMPLLSRITYEGDTHSLNERGLVSKLQEMYRKNYADKPKLLQRLLDSFEKTRNNERAQFEIVYLGDEPVAFCAFEYEGGGSLHFGKFNVNPEFAGRQLGEQILEETVDDYAHTQILKAECDRDARIASKYIERGFIATAEYPLDEIQCWDIYRNDSMNEDLETKQFDEEEIINYSVINEWSDISISTKKSSAKVLTIPESRLKGQSINLLSDQKGYVVTRMFRRKIVDQDENMVFIVVEKVSAKFLERYKSQFTMPQAIQTRHTYIV